MISFLRKMFDSWIGRVIALAFIVLIGFAFALADVSGSLGGGTTGRGATVATVGDAKISASEYSAALKSEYERVRSQNPNVDIATYLASDTGKSVLDRLIASYTMAAFADENGIAVSKAMIDSEIAKLPGMTGVDGSFNAEAYNAFLVDRGLTDDQIRRDAARGYFADQLLTPASYGAAPTDKATMRYAAINFETRAGKVAVLPSVAFVPTGEPSDAQLKKFYTDEAERFTIPERRAISYATFGPDLIDARAKPTDADIAAYYKDNSDEFAASKTVRYQQLIVPSREAAQQVETRVKAGEDFAAVADALGFALSEQSSASQKTLAASAGADFAKALYAAGKGQLAAPVKGELGFVVARVTDIEQRPARSLDEARADIAQIVGAQKRSEALAALTEDIQDRFDDGETLGEVAKSYNLEVLSTPLLLPNGNSPESRSYQASDMVKSLVRSAFDIYPDDPPQLVQAGENSFALLAVKETAEAAPPPLAEVRPLVVAAWKVNQGEVAAKKAGEAALKKVKAGTPLAQAIAEINKRLPAPQTIRASRQEIAQQGGQVPPALFALFQIPSDGERLVPVGQDRGFLLIQVDEVVPAKIAADDPRLPQFRQQFARSMQNELQRQFVTALQQTLGVTVHEDARDEVLRQLGGAS